MKKILFTLLLFSTVVFSQTTTTPVGSIKHNNLLELNSTADTLLVRNPKTKKLEGVSKLVLIEQVKATIAAPTVSSVIGLQDALNLKVDKVTGKSLISDTEITRLSGVTNQDLSPYETISSNNTKLGLKVDKVTGKSLISDTEITRLSGVTNQDLSPYETISSNNTKLGLKVDKVTGKSLISDTEITRLSSVTNQDISGKLNTSEKGIANGVATLDASGKLPMSQIPSTLVGVVVFQGTYNATTASPTLPDPTGNKGSYWSVNVAGTQYGNIYGIKDWIISDGTKYDIVKNNNDVTSVAGKTGAVVLTTTDVSEGSRLYFTDARVTNNTSVLTNTAKVTNATHTGEVTGSNVLTITNNIVSNTKLSTVPSKTLKGRTSGGVGNVEDLTVAQVKGDLAIDQVNNTSDLNKPISTSTQSSLNLKVDKVTGKSLISDTEITRLSGVTNQDLSPYETISSNNTKLGLKVDKVTGKSLILDSEITRLATVTNQDISGKENAFSKNTAFNKNFGTTAGTVVEGNDSRILNGQTAYSWGNHAGLYPSLTGTGAAGTWGINISGNSQTSSALGTYNWNPTVKDNADYMFGRNSANEIAIISQLGVRNFLGLGSNAYTSTAFTPTTGGTGYIQNQNVSAQTANMWISGTSQFNQGVLLGTENNDGNSFQLHSRGKYNGEPGVSYGGEFRWYASPNGSFHKDNALYQLRSADTSDNIESNIFTITGNGAATFASTVTASPATLGTQLATLGQVKRLGYSTITGSNINQASFRTALGLGSNAYNSTAYLPLTGGTINTNNETINYKASSNNGALYNSWYDFNNNRVSFLGFGGGTQSNAPFFITSENGGNIALNTFGDGRVTVSSLSGAGDGNIVAAPDGALKRGVALGSNAYTSTVIPTNTNQLTNGSGYITDISGKENTFSKNTAFNKNFGTTAGTVVEGGTLGTNAYNSTAYLPLSGGTVNGPVLFNSTIGGSVSFQTNSLPLALMTSSRNIIGASGSTTDFNTYVYGNNPYNIWTNGIKRVTVDGSGNATFTGTVTASGGFFNSDRRLKNIFKRDGDVAYYTWKDGRDNKQHIGYVAQEVQENHPNQVQADEKGILSVNYVEILVEKIRVLEKRIEQLEKRN